MSAFELLSWELRDLKAVLIWSLHSFLTSENLERSVNLDFRSFSSSRIQDFMFSNYVPTYSLKVKIRL